jgi:hypothetical protein
MFPPTKPLFKAGYQKILAKDYIGALSDFDQIIELNPSPRAYAFRSMARRGLGDEKGAAEDMAIFTKMGAEYSKQINRGFQRLRSWDVWGGSQDIYSGVMNLLVKSYIDS